MTNNSNEIKYIRYFFKYLLIYVLLFSGLMLFAVRDRIQYQNGEKQDLVKFIYEGF